MKIETIFKPNHIGFYFVPGFIDKYQAEISGITYWWSEAADTWKLLKITDSGHSQLVFILRKFSKYLMDARVIILRLSEMSSLADVTEYSIASYRQYKIDELMKPD